MTLKLKLKVILYHMLDLIWNRDLELRGSYYDHLHLLLAIDAYSGIS